MCTYLTEHVAIDGSGKGATGWFGADRATVYVDHPVHAPYGHTVNIDVINPQLGPSARVALELTGRARWHWPTPSRATAMHRPAWHRRTRRERRR